MAKSELQEMGEETDDMVVSTSKLRNQIMSMTGVDIMLDESTFKSTYQILLEIGKMYDKLTDIERTSLIELIAGKNRSNIAAAILQSPDILEKAYNTSLNSEGSAQKEMNTYLDSIEGRLSRLKSTFQSTSQIIISNDVIKNVLSLADALLSAANGALKLSTNLFSVFGEDFVDAFTPLQSIPTILTAISAVLGAFNKDAGTTVPLVPVMERVHKPENCWETLIPIYQIGA